MLMNDKEIAALCGDESGMIWPFVPEKTSVVDGKAVMSFGLSSAGYDVSIAGEWGEVWPNSFKHNHIKSGQYLSVDYIDPQAEQNIEYSESDAHMLLPGKFILARTVEYFRIPTTVMVVCVGKSTYARCGVLVNVTPIEPGFAGHITIEIHNAGEFPVLIRKGAIAQFLFHRIKEPVNSYGNGKYQGQTGIVGARMAVVK